MTRKHPPTRSCSQPLEEVPSGASLRYPFPQKTLMISIFFEVPSITTLTASPTRTAPGNAILRDLNAASHRRARRQRVSAVLADSYPLYCAKLANLRVSLHQEASGSIFQMLHFIVPNLLSYSPSVACRCKQAHW